MNKTKRIAFSIGMVLTVLAVLTVSAAADEYFYLLPEDSNCTEVGCTTTVLAMVHTDRSDIGSSQIHLEFDPSIVNITNIEAPTDPTWHMWLWKHEGDYVFAVGNHFGGVGPGELQVGKMTLECKNPGVSPLEYTHFYPQTPDPTAIATTLGDNCPATAINGTFTCIGVAETFEKDLSTGWNLVSLPLIASDMTIGSVFNSVGGSYSEIYSYDVETKNFMVLSETDELENGVGYFIHMNSADTWTYEGGVYTMMNEPLSKGLNMVGWLNCSKPIEDALSSIEGKYRYVARWDAQTQKYKVYVPGAPPAFNDFDTMEPGVGYFISMKVDGETISEGC